MYILNKLKKSFHITFWLVICPKDFSLLKVFPLVITNLLVINIVYFRQSKPYIIIFRSIGNGLIVIQNPVTII